MPQPEVHQKEIRRNEPEVLVQVLFRRANSWRVVIVHMGTRPNFSGFPARHLGQVELNYRTQSTLAAIRALANGPHRAANGVPRTFV